MSKKYWETSSLACTVGLLLLVSASCSIHQRDSSSTVSTSNLPILFDFPLATDTQTNSPRSIKQLSQVSPAFPPVEELPDEYWKEQDCSNCHQWDKANLCVQGQFYVKNPDNVLDRIKHPHGGFFKRALKQWADSGCQ